MRFRCDACGRFYDPEDKRIGFRYAPDAEGSTESHEVLCPSCNGHPTEEELMRAEHDNDAARDR